MVQRAPAHERQRRDLERCPSRTPWSRARSPSGRTARRTAGAGTGRPSAPGRRAGSRAARRLRPPGRVSTMRCTGLRSSASTAQATARKVLPVPAGPMPKVMSCDRMWRRYCTWFGVRPARSARRVCSTTATRCRRRSARGCALPPASARLTACASSGRDALFVQRRPAAANACSARALAPSTRKAASRRVMRTSSAASIVRRCASSRAAQVGQPPVVERREGVAKDHGEARARRHCQASVRSARAPRPAVGLRDRALAAQSSRSAPPLRRDIGGFTARALHPHRESGSRRHCRRRVVPTFGGLVHGALGLVLCLLSLLASAQTLRFTQALAVAADTEYFPAELPQVQTVELPDDWASSRPDQSGPVWYRLTFDADAVRASGELLALYIERACSAVAVRLNGKLVHLSRPAHRAGVAQLPAPAAGGAADRPGCAAQQPARPEGDGLSAAAGGVAPARRRAVGGRAGPVRRAGQQAQLAHGGGDPTARGDQRQLAAGGRPDLRDGLDQPRAELPRLLRRAADRLGHGAVAPLDVATCHGRTRSAEFLLAILASFVTLAAVQFLLRYAGERRRWVDVGLPAQCAVMPLTLMVMGAQHLHAMATFWYVVLAVEVGAASLLYLRKTWLARRAQFWPMATLGALMAIGCAGGVHRSAVRRRCAHRRRGADHPCRCCSWPWACGWCSSTAARCRMREHDRAELERRVQRSHRRRSSATSRSSPSCASSR